MFAAMHESASDAVDGSSIRHASAMDLGAVRAPDQFKTRRTVSVDHAGGAGASA
jgi:hypothetical protein